MALSIEEIEKRIDDSYELPNRVLDAMPEPMVTVRTSTYQHGPYIKQCIEGVLMQKTTFPFEFIIGEDFSTDGTRGTVFEYAKKYPDIIRVITADYNVGMKANGQRCIRASRGKYMAICEGDDYWTYPYKLQKQVDFLEKNRNYSMCCHNAVIINEGRDILPSIFSNLIRDIDINISDIVNKWIIPTASIVFKRDCIVDYPQWTSKIYSGDLTLSLLLADKGKIRIFKDIMSVYRKSFVGESMTAKMRGKFLFMQQQHILLLKYFNEETKGKYSNILNKRIVCLQREVKFYKLRSKNVFLAMLCIPLFFVKKVKEKCKRVFLKGNIF